MRLSGRLVFRPKIDPSVWGTSKALLAVRKTNSSENCAVFSIWRTSDSSTGFSRAASRDLLLKSSYSLNEGKNNFVLCSKVIKEKPGNSLAIPLIMLLQLASAGCSRKSEGTKRLFAISLFSIVIQFSKSTATVASKSGVSEKRRSTIQNSGASLRLRSAFSSISPRCLKSSLAW